MLSRYAWKKSFYRGIKATRIVDCRVEKPGFYLRVRESWAVGHCPSRLPETHLRDAIGGYRPKLAAAGLHEKAFAVDARGGIALPEYGKAPVFLAQPMRHGYELGQHVFFVCHFMISP